MSHVTLADTKVGPIGYGLMGLTWRPHPQPAADSMAAMKTALDLGANFWNGGELYGTPERNSLHLLKEYFDQNPSDAPKVFLSIKGGLLPGKMQLDGSEKNIRRSVDECVRLLGGTKKIDIFECARVDPNVPIEDSIRTLHTLQQEGKIGGIGLSEVAASTIRRAAAVAPITAVEVELSLWATDILTNDIAATCAELDIPIVAYSPLARGMLAGETIRCTADLPEGDLRRRFPKFQDDVLEHNNKLTDEVTKLSARKGCTKAQVAIAWVRQLSGRKVPVPDGSGKEVKLGMIIPIPGATKVERVIENTTLVELSEEEMREIDVILRTCPVKGARYPKGMHTDG